MVQKEKNNISACVICANRDFILILKAHDYIFSSPMEFNFMRCTRCKEVSVVPRPSGQYTHPEASYKKSGKTDVWHFLQPNRPEKIRQMKKSGRILDIGCGLGEFLSEMKTLGWEVYGNDILADACRYAKEEFGLENIYNKDLLSLDFSDNFFDVVTLWHVFGHLEKLPEALKKINGILKDDGLLIIESPNFDSCQRKIFKDKWYGLALPHYFYHFSPKSIKYALRQAGFEIIKKDYFVNLRIDFVSFKESLLRLLHLEHVPDEKNNTETAFLRWLKRYKLIFLFEIICFFIASLLALINCGTCFRVYCKKIEQVEKSKNKAFKSRSMLIKKAKVALGVILRKVIAGPIEISIDITNRCGLGCITCWFYSPLKKDKIDLSWANQEMNFDLFKKIVNEARKLDVKKIMVGAEGDPFLHPQIIDMLEYGKASNFIVDTATCGVFFNEKNLKALVDIGIDSMNVSILAATSQVYQKMHPNQKEDLFEKIKQSLISLSILKRKNGSKLPYVRLVYVVCKLNYQEVDEIIDFAKFTGSNAVVFKRLDITPFTKELLLNESQIIELGVKLDIAKEKAKANLIYANVDEFRRFNLNGLSSGDYTSGFYSKVPCYVGWTYSRILADGKVLPCCGCCDYILGDLNKQSLKEIWNSAEYNEFRKRSLKITKDKSITQKCFCHSCVHASSNLGVYRNLHLFKR